MAMQTNYIQAAQQQGGQANGLANRQREDQTKWRQMIEVAKMDTPTAVGFGLGRLLSNAWMNHLAERHDKNNVAYREGQKAKGEFDNLEAQLNDLTGQITGLQQANADIDNPQPTYNVGEGIGTVEQALNAGHFQDPWEKIMPTRQIQIPQDGKQAVDGAVMDGITKEKNNQQIAQLQAKQAELTQRRDALGQVLSQMGLNGYTPQEQAMVNAANTDKLLTGLLGFQQQYQNAANNNDQAGMEAAHAGAAQLREQARAAGVDPALLNENLTMEEVANLAAQNEWNSAFGGMSADDYQQLTYNRLRANGMGHRAAKEMSGEAAARYQAQRLSGMQNAFMKYGIDNNNALNTRGVQALMQMAQNGGEETANLIANMFPGLKDAYNLNAQEKLLGTKNAYTQSNMRLGGQIDMEKAAQKHAYDEESANNDVNRKLTYLAKSLGLKQQGTFADMQQRYNVGLGMGLQGENLVRFTLTGNYGASGGKSKGNGSNGGSNSSDGGMKISDANTVIQQYNKWAEDHPDDDPETNPFKDGRDRAVDVMNGYSEVPEDVNNANSVYSWATKICEQNYQRGYQLTEDQLVQVISNVGGYGPQVAQQLKEEGKLSGDGGYGRKE